ncbi:hypothetical protein DFH28DRAFT_926748 [Melampsora americana]|nr:hypothetical protein DFH28DRAFT_926748 [Melampsora americana]
MMSSDHSTAILHLQYPPIICPLPRRTHSYPYPSPYSHSNPKHSLQPNHRHSSRSRRTPSISTAPSHSSRSPSRIHNLSPKPVSPLPPSSIATHSNLNPNEDLKSNILSDSSSILTRSKLSSSFDLDSKPPAEDDVLSEFLSLFIPSSPQIVHSITPTISPVNYIRSTPQPSQRRSVTGHRPRSRLAGSPHLTIESEPSKRIDWLIASPISRCHNPLPRHSNLDILASKLTDPIQAMVLTDPQDDSQDRKLSSPVMIS